MKLDDLEKRGIPYYCLELTKEQAEIISNKSREIEWYEVNGNTIFEVRDVNGKPTGKWVAYLLFKE